MAAPSTLTSIADPAPLPPLENGDRLTREEFERRYSAMPDLKKAELIEGIVYMPSPVRARVHGFQHADLITFFGMYRVGTTGIYVADNSTLRLDLDNEPQPDGVVCIDPAFGGQCRFTDDYLTNGPELVGEIASSSVSLDLGRKFHVFRQNNVREYIVWRVLDRAIDWFISRNGQFDRLAAGHDGIHRSEVFPGLWLDAAALIAGDLQRVHRILQQGLTSPQHAAFMAMMLAHGA